MEFKVNTKEFERVLSQLIPIIPSRTPLVILEHFLLSIRDNLLIVYATDSNIAFQTSIPVISNGDFEATVPARLLHDTVKSLPDTDIKIVFQESDKRMVIHTDTGKFSLVYASHDEFPKLPKVEEKLSFNISGEKLKYALETTDFAYDRESQRLSLTGILMDIKTDKVVFVSTDGHRLVKLSFKNITTDFEAQIIIPGKSANILSKLLDEKEVRIIGSEKLVKFEIDSSEFITRIIEEKYPNYESVIPLENENVLKINREDLLKVLKRISLYTHSKTRQIKFTLDKDILSVFAENMEMGSEAIEKMLCEYSGEQMTVAFKVDFLIDILNNISTNEVYFKLDKPVRPCLVEPLTQNENENLLMLVMPMRINA